MAALLTSFVWWENRVARPMLDPDPAENQIAGDGQHRRLLFIGGDVRLAGAVALFLPDGAG